MYTKQYFDLLNHVVKFGAISVNERTGVGVRTSPRPQFIRIDMKNGLVPLPGNRTIYPRVGASEVAWQFLGTKDPEFIMKHAPKVWGDFIEDGELKSAYGHRWYNQFGRNQIHLAIEALKKDETSRQVYVSTWDPSTDGLGETGQPKNIPCIVGFTLTIVDGHLNLAVNMRSSDVYVGLPYDIITYGLMLDAFAVSIGVRRGYLTFQLANAHIYEPHVPSAANEIDEAVDLYKPSDMFKISWADNVQEVLLPGWSVEEIEKDPEGYVEYFKGIKIKNFNHSQPKVVV